MERRLEARVWERAKGRCEYCQIPHQFDEPGFEIDHIVADQHGGPTILSNLALACFRCNRAKGPNVGSMDRVTGKLVRLFNPRRHKWPYHFEWDGPVLMGRTPIGRVTVAVLNINATHRVALRRLFIDEGVFPPGAEDE